MPLFSAKATAAACEPGLGQTHLLMRQEFAEIARESTKKRKSVLDQRKTPVLQQPRLSGSSTGKGRAKVVPAVRTSDADNNIHSRERKKWQQFRISKIDLNCDNTVREDDVQRTGSITRLRIRLPKKVTTISLKKIVLLFVIVFAIFTSLLVFGGFKINESLGPAWHRFQQVGMSKDDIEARYVLDAVEWTVLKTGLTDMGPEQARSAVGDITKVNCVVFSIVVQVTTILIQVGAREVSSNAIQLFVSDKIIVSGMTLYTLTLSYMLVLTNSISEAYIPRGEILIASAFTLASVLLLIPYFMYLSRLLNPLRLVRKVAEAGLKACTYVENPEAVQRKSASEIEKDRKMAIWAVENISQFSLNAVQHKRLPLVYACIEVLCHFLIGYNSRKDLWDYRWFRITDGMREKPDFFSLSERGARDLERRRCWLEWKVLRQFHSIFVEAFDSMKDVTYVISVNTRQIGEAAALRHDYHAMEYCTRFFNTFVRLCINKRDVHTTRNVLHQYTLLCIAVLSNDTELLNLVQQRKRKAMADGVEFHEVDDLIQITGNYVVEESRDIIIAMEKKMIAVAGHFAFYSRIAVQAGVSNISENIAHELVSVCETAYLRKRESHEEILLVLLMLHEAPREKNLHAVTWGIRAAQIKLATFYADHNGMDFFKCIQNTFRHASRTDLIRVWRRLEQIQEREFWEVLNHEANHEYITPECKEYLPLFFEPFGITINDIQTNLTVVQQETSETNFIEANFGIASVERGLSDASFMQSTRMMMESARTKSVTGSSASMDPRQDFVLPFTERSRSAADDEELGASQALQSFSGSASDQSPSASAAARFKSTVEEVLHVRRRASDVSDKNLVPIEDYRLASVHSLAIEEEEESEDGEDEDEDSNDEITMAKLNQARNPGAI